MHTRLLDVLAIVGILQISVILAFGNKEDASQIYTSLQTEEIFSHIEANNENDPLLARIAAAKCNFESISSATQICEMLFFIRLKSDQKVLCTDVYDKMRECVLAKHSQCPTKLGTRAKRAVRKSLSYYMKARYCNDGSLSPKSRLPANYCTMEYTERVKVCYESYHRAFRQNISDEALCELYENATICSQEVEEETCVFKSVVKQVRAFSTNISRCWNPFCTRNVRGFDEAIGNGRLSFSHVRRMVEGKLHVFEMRQKVMGALRNKSQLKRGVPDSCPHNSAALITEALAEIIEELKSSQNDEPTDVVSTNSVIGLHVKTNAKISAETARTVKSSGNNAVNFSRGYLSVILYILPVIIIEVYLRESDLFILK